MGDEGMQPAEPLDQPFGTAKEPPTMRTRRSIAIKIALLGGVVTLAAACSNAAAAPA